MKTNPKSNNAAAGVAVAAFRHSRMLYNNSELCYQLKRPAGSPAAAPLLSVSLSTLACTYGDLDPNTVRSSPPWLAAPHSSAVGSVLSRCTLDASSKLYQESMAQTTAQVLELNRRLSEVGGAPAAIARHLSRQKMVVKDRLEHLVDPGTPWLELSALVANKVAVTASAHEDDHAETPVGAGLITAIGIVAGRPVMIVANDATVKGGTYFPLTVKKHLRAQRIAWENKLPCIYLVDSGGAYLPQQRNVFPDRDHFGRIFYHQAQMSADGIPQIAVVCGSCTAGGAYVPSMSDETIIVRDNGTIFLAGPPLVQAATGEIVSAEQLGGAVVHTHISGVADHIAETELDALHQARDIIASLGQDVYSTTITTTTTTTATTSTTTGPFYEEPLFPTEEMRALVPADAKQPMDMYALLARLLDGSRFQEFKANYGKTLLCGFGKIQGQEVAILANNGILFPESAQKGCHFIELACQRGIPLLFLQNITGFMVGTKYEHAGIAKHGAKLVTAVATASVPKLTVVVGASYGAGNYGMCGRAYDPRFLFLWPNARIGVMGGEQAANVLWTVQQQQQQQQQQQSNNNKNEKDNDEERKFKRTILERYERESSAYFSTANLWDDGIIDPADTRRVLGMALAIARRRGCQPNDTKFGIFRM